MAQASGSAPPKGFSGAVLFLVFVLVGAAVSLALGVYSKVHTPTGETIVTFGFPTLIQMKVGLTTAALVLACVQVVTALRIYGRFGAGPCPPAVTMTHRLSGGAAVLLTLPVAYHCLWSLGFGSYSTRVVVHSVLGCAFYGVFVTKMLAVKSKRLPEWAIPIAGGVLFAVLVAVWLTSALWYFTSGAQAY